MQLNRRQFMGLSTAAAAALLPGVQVFGASQMKKLPARPNFLVILADDLGAKELGCYGNTAHQTPVLDGLARTGVQYRTAYACPICHPSRVMLLTGQYGCHNGVYNFSGRRGGPEPESPEENIGENHFTFAEMLKEYGYATALGGKWQLSGHGYSMIHDSGFDEYCVWAYKNYLPEGVNHTGGWEKQDEKPARYWDPCVMKNGRYLPLPEGTYGPDLFTDFLIDFMKRHKDMPFCAYYPMCLTHGPHQRTPDNRNLDDDALKDRDAVFKGCVEYTDKLVGRLVAALEELGLRENTVILFMGDNGTGGDGKAAPTELGARVPMIVSGPGIIEARGETDELIDLSDVFPTLADFAHIPLPENTAIDGKSNKAFLTGESETTRDWIFSFIADRRILRTNRWLLEDNSPLHYGHLYDCGSSRDGTGYREVTDSEDKEAVAARRYFDSLLEKLPAPVLKTEGLPAGKK